MFLSVYIDETCIRDVYSEKQVDTDAKGHAKVSVKTDSAAPITFLFHLVHEKKIEPKRWSVFGTLTYFAQLVQHLSAFSL